MWDPRYGDYAAQLLAEAWADAAVTRLAAAEEPPAAGCPHRWRVALGRLLMRAGERLVAQPVRP